MSAEPIKPPDALVESALQRIQREIETALIGRQATNEARRNYARKRANEDPALAQELLAAIEEDEDRAFLIVRPYVPGQGPSGDPLPKERRGWSLATFNVESAPEGAPPEVTPRTAADLLRHHAESMALDLALQVSWWADVFIPSALRSAALARPLLLERWRLPHGKRYGNEPSGIIPADIGWFLLEALQSQESRRDRRRAALEQPDNKPMDHDLYWPGEAAPLDVAQWAKDAANKLFPPVGKGREGMGDLIVRDVQEGGRIIGFGNLFHGRSSSLFPGNLALLYLAAKAVEEDRKRPMVAVDAGKANHALLQSWRDVPKDSRREHEFFPDESGGRLELLAPGGVVQLTLPLDGQGSPQEATIQALRAWRGPEALRDWAALQRLWSVEGGRSGSVRWTLDGHLEARNMPMAHRSQQAKREKIARQVEFLTKIELAAYAKDGKIRERRPLILVGAKFDRLEGSRWRLDGMELQPNPLIYSNVREENGRIGTNWFPAPVELPQIDHSRFPFAIALGLILPIRWRWAWGDGKDHVALSGANLLELAGIKHDSRRPGETWDKLERNLAELERKGGLGRWRWDDGEPSRAGICRLFPAEWAADRTLHGIKPLELPPAPAVKTGAELRAWRDERGWLQAEAAKRLGVSQATISRAEGKGAQAIPQRLAEALRRLA